MVDNRINIYYRGKQAFKVAEESGQEEILSYLQLKMDGYDIVLASKNGDLEQVKYLIGKEVDNNFEGSKSLKIACFRGHYEIVRLLLENGAEILTKDSVGKKEYFSLILAAKNGHLKVVKLLISYGSDVEARAIEKATKS
jgi:ankyrin repeat protein